MKLNFILTFAAALAIGATPFAFSQEPEIEVSPTLSASAILKPEFASGPNFTVRDAVPTFGGRNDYMIDSDFGTFEADGNAMLVSRVREIAAIAKLREISLTDEYSKALEKAAQSPLLLAKSLITNPVSTVSGVPDGLWKFMNRAGEGVKEFARGRESSEAEGSNAEQLIGFAKAKRNVAVKLGVDPYSSNEALQRELNAVAWAAYAGNMTFTLASIPIGGGVGVALTATNVADTLTQAITDMSPSDLRLANLKRLSAMGVDEMQAQAFLDNSAFNPSVQTAIVMQLGTLEGAANRGSFVNLAAQQASSEGDALFFLSTSRVLAELQSRGRPIARLDVIDSLPVAIGEDGTTIAALEWDYAAWTAGAFEFVTQLKAAKFGEKAPTGILIAITGDASPLAQTAAADAKVELATRLSPGPLK